MKTKINSLEKMILVSIGFITSTQNPSLTYMALTARAADYAISQMKKGEL